MCIVDIKVFCTFGVMETLKYENVISFFISARECQHKEYYFFIEITLSFKIKKRQQILWYNSLPPFKPFVPYFFSLLHMIVNCNVKVEEACFIQNQLKYLWSVSSVTFAGGNGVLSLIPISLLLLSYSSCFILYSWSYFIWVITLSCSFASDFEMEWSYFWSWQAR